MRFVPNPAREPLAENSPVVPDAEHVVRAIGKSISDALWRLDSARAQLRWAKAEPALDAAAARITEAEQLIEALATRYAYPKG